jgi:hypothetical protein
LFPISDLNPSEFSRLKKSLEYFQITIHPFHGSEILKNNSTYQAAILDFTSTATQSLEWKCIYRASEHQFSSAQYHQQCGYQTNTLVIVRSENGNIFGGFISIATSQSAIQYRQSQGYSAKHSSPVSVRDEKAFLFTLVNQENIPPQIFRPTRSEGNIYQDLSYGPCWGPSNDLWISNGPQSMSRSNLGSHYSNPHSKPYLLAGTNQFKVTEYEVWVPAY